jgi:dipeptidyl aminopeptidase/acylaminoacyl peptidase
MARARESAIAHPSRTTAVNSAASGAGGVFTGSRDVGGRVLMGLALVAALVLVGRVSGAQTNAPRSASRPWAELGRTIPISNVAISPDGSRVAWVEKREGEPGRLLVSRSRPPAGPTVVALAGARKRGENSPAWSPDSSRLAFVSDAGGNGQSEVWIARGEGAGARRLTDVSGYVAKPRWSPDGSAIAFLHVPGGGGGGPLLPHGARTGVIQQVIHNQRIAVVNVETREVRLASPPDLNVYEFDWSPDGRSFAATAAPGPGDDNWWVAQLYVVDRAAGAARLLYQPTRQIAVPRWSPDGAEVAFIEGLMSDQGANGGDLFIVPVAGGRPRDCAPGRKASPSWLRWLSPREILFTEYQGGGSGISTLDTSSGATTTLWHGAERVTAGSFSPSFSVARDGVTSALVRQSFQTAPEVWTGRIGSWKQLSRTNTGQSAEWGQAESLEWRNDGLDVQGWLIPPKVIEPSRRYPMVVVVHGGPSSVVLPTFPDLQHTTGALMADGYFVFLPNPRGSFGQGEAFTTANVKDFGGGDLRDILAGIDAVLARYPVDPGRLGITGWSYGGYMTMWAVTQTDRFHAAVAGAGIANWQSYYGENLIDTWMIPFFGASVYADPAVYAKSSPITFITHVKTPTLVIVGERDAECPAPQSFEFWHALKTLGVPTQLVVYPGEGHHFSDPSHLKDRVERTLAWFDRYLAQ